MHICQVPQVTVGEGHRWHRASHGSHTHTQATQVSPCTNVGHGDQGGIEGRKGSELEVRGGMKYAV